MYESKDFGLIESRCNEETDDALAIYKTMFDIKKQNDFSIARLKKLDKMSEIQHPVASEI